MRWVLYGYQQTWGVEGKEEAHYLAKNAAHEDRIEIALQDGLSELHTMNKSVKEMW